MFPADEFYSLAGIPVPSDESYEDYPQIENGIGMLRQLMKECEEAFPAVRRNPVLADRPPRHILIPTGVSALSCIRDLAGRYARKEDQVDVFPVPNRFFGPSVTVTGLITGRDLMDALRGKEADYVMISVSMLRENGDQFLDDLTVSDLSKETGLPFRIVQNRGEDFINALYGA